MEKASEFHSIKSGITHYLFLVVVTAIGSISLFATDIYLPALPEMAQFFGVNSASIQTSFSGFFIGLAVCQLIAGILSDRLGRKRVLMTGLFIFSVASLMGGFCRELAFFDGLRLMQAMGGGVGSVVFRALIIDRFNRLEAAKVFAMIFPIIGLSSAIAPLIGGFLCAQWGWRSVCFFMGAFGLSVMVLAHCCLSSLKVCNVPMAVLNPPDQNYQKYISLFKNREFLGYALVVCTSFCAFRSYSVGSPFVFSQQGYFAESIGFFYIGLSCTYLFGGVFARYISPKIGMQHALFIGMMIILIGSLSMVSTSFFFEYSPYAIIVPMCVIGFGNGLLFPVGSAAALTVVSSQLSGSAAGLMGCIQFLLAAYCARSIGTWCNGQPMQLASFISMVVLIGLTCVSILIFKSNRESATQELV